MAVRFCFLFITKNGSTLADADEIYFRGISMGSLHRFVVPISGDGSHRQILTHCVTCPGMGPAPGSCTHL